jgi:hydrogenase small subunit
VIAIGSCASWGGVPSADPNPTGAVGVDSIITGKPIVNLPGCPPNPYNLLGVVLEYVTMGKLPRTRRGWPSEVCLRARDSRKLPAARPL